MSDICNKECAYNCYCANESVGDKCEGFYSMQEYIDNLMED